MTIPHEDMQWRKSSFSTHNNCVEFRRTPDGVEVRNSKRPDEAIIRYTTSEWDAFLKGVKDGEFDL